jgi:hypothetical protein
MDHLEKSEPYQTVFLVTSQNYLLFCGKTRTGTFRVNNRLARCKLLDFGHKFGGIVTLSKLPDINCYVTLINMFSWGRKAVLQELRILPRFNEILR